VRRTGDRGRVATGYERLRKWVSSSRAIGRLNSPRSPGSQTAWVDWPWIDVALRAVFHLPRLTRAPAPRVLYALITQLLDTADVRALGGTSTAAWNEHFGRAGKTLSTKHMQSRGWWALTRYDPHIADDDEFVKTTRFKWSWKIKPDLVVHTTLDHALVIEAKLESGEGRYPANTADRAVFIHRQLDPVPQTALQQHMLKVLGVTTKSVCVVNKANIAPTGFQQLLWYEVFAALDLTGLPTFAATWLKQYVP